MVFLTGTEFSGSAVVSYHAVPVSDFSYIDVGLELSLFNLSENASYYYWDFGDGNTSTEENPVHIYNSQGVYEVSLSTENDQCAGNSLSEIISISTTPGGEDPPESEGFWYGRCDRDLYKNARPHCSGTACRFT